METTNYQTLIQKLDNFIRKYYKNQLIKGFLYSCGLVFLFFIIYPALTLRKELHPLYWCFFIIILVSFITEDTLENQAGVTLFAFFNSMFMWSAFEKSKAKHRVN